MSLLSLPDELIAEMIEYVGPVALTLLSLSLVSRRIHHIANSAIYRRPIDLLRDRVLRNRRDSLLSSLCANDGGNGRLVRSLDKIVDKLPSPLLAQVDIPLNGSPELLHSVCKSLALSASRIRHISLRADGLFGPLQFDAPAVLDGVTSTLSIDTLASLSVFVTGKTDVATTAPLEQPERNLKHLLRLDVFAYSSDSSIQMLRMVRLTNVSGLRHIVLDVLDLSDAQLNEIVSLLTSGLENLSLSNEFSSDEIYPTLPLAYFGSASQLRRLDLRGLRAPFGSLLAILASSAIQLEHFSLTDVEWTSDVQPAPYGVVDIVELAATLRKFPRLVACYLGSLPTPIRIKPLRDVQDEGKIELRWWNRSGSNSDASDA